MGCGIAQTQILSPGRELVRGGSHRQERGRGGDSPPKKSDTGGPGRVSGTALGSLAPPAPRILRGASGHALAEMSGYGFSQCLSYLQCQGVGRLREALLADHCPCSEPLVLGSLLADSPGSLALAPAAPGGGLLGPSHSYSSSPLSLFRLQEQFRQHMAATNNLVHYSSFEVGGPAPAAAAAVPYLGVNMAPLGSLHCQSYYQSLSAAAAAHQGVWGSPLLPAPPAGLAPASAALNSKTTSIENLRLRAKQHAASLGLDTLPN